MSTSCGVSFAFCDPRRFGKMWLQASPLTSHPVNSLGWDALYEVPPQPDFCAAVADTRRPIKALLLDQSFSAGVGNWVADEILYQAGVHPEAKGETLSDVQLVAIYESLCAVLQTAVKLEAESPDFPREWLFHYRWTGKQATKDFHGKRVSFVSVGGRTSAVVLDKQKMGQRKSRGGGGEAGKREGQASASNKKTKKEPIRPESKSIEYTNDTNKPKGKKATTTTTTTTTTKTTTTTTSGSRSTQGPKRAETKTKTKKKTGSDVVYAGTDDDTKPETYSGRSGAASDHLATPRAQTPSTRASRGRTFRAAERGRTDGHGKHEVGTGRTRAPMSANVKQKSGSTGVISSGKKRKWAGIRGGDEENGNGSATTRRARGR